MRRKTQALRAKEHRPYTVDEAARAKKVHKGTIRAWLKAGLKSLDTSRPLMIRGCDLNKFCDEQRQKAKSPCTPGTIYCVCCKLPQTPAGLSVEYLPLTPKSGNLRGRCPDCSRSIYRRVALASIASVTSGLTVTFPEESGRIREASARSGNTDSEGE